MSLSQILDSSTSNQSWKVLEVNSVNTSADVSIGGNLTVAGSSTFNGPVNFMSNGPLLPSADNVDDLGSAIKRWRTLYAGTNVNVDGDINMGGTLNSNAGQCIQATGTIFTTGTIGAGANVNGDVFNVQSNNNQLVFTHNSGNATIVDCPAPAASRTYTLPDVGSNGSFVVADSSNDITVNNATVNQLNYTTLNPAITIFKPRSYIYRKSAPTVLPAAGVEQGQNFELAVYEDVAGDITNNLGSFTFNNAGQYSVNMSLKVLTTGSNVGAAFAINGDPERWYEGLGGSDINWNGTVVVSGVFNVNAADTIFCLANPTATSAGQTIGGPFNNSSFISFVRLA